MISIIVCSVNPDLLRTLEQNIADTIGVKYEIIATDNRKNNKGICEVYNKAAIKARYEIICFLHEDIIIHTLNWGNKLVELLKNTSIGLVGISGTVYKSKYPAIWSSCDSALYRTNSIQHFKYPLEKLNTNTNTTNEKFTSVAVVDGVFLTTTKQVFDEFKFSENDVHGFHGYDIDFSLKVGQHYNVVVSYDILLEHLSEGKLTEDWLLSSIYIHKKWSLILPRYSENVQSFLKKRSDYLSILSVLGVAVKYSGFRCFVLKNYLDLVFKFWKFNKLNFTKTCFKYLLK